MTSDAALGVVMVGTFQKMEYCVIVHLLGFECMFRHQGANPDLLIICLLIVQISKMARFPICNAQVLDSQSFCHELDSDMQNEGTDWLIKCVEFC